jgi:hypothetical protein
VTFASRGGADVFFGNSAAARQVGSMATMLATMILRMPHSSAPDAVFPARRPLARSWPEQPTAAFIALGNVLGSGKVMRFHDKRERFKFSAAHASPISPLR